MNKEDTSELLFRLKEGDEKGFTDIYNKYWDRLYYMAFQKLRNQDAAEEVVQEVFLKLWKKRNELTISCLSSYLAAMVRYAVYRYLASESAKKNREFTYDAGQVKIVNMGDQIENKLILDKIIELSNQLPEKCRLVFQSIKLQDQSLKTVAEELNISPKTAEAHLTKSLKLIKLNMRGFLHLFL